MSVSGERQWPSWAQVVSLPGVQRCCEQVAGKALCACIWRSSLPMAARFWQVLLSSHALQLPEASS